MSSPSVDHGQDPGSADLALMAETERLLAELVSFPSVSGRPNGDLVQYIRDHLLRYGVASAIDPNDDCTRYNLFATIGPEVDGGLVLCGHTDVVPADPAQWDGDPFALRQDGVALVGRGAVDMKGFVACILAMVPRFVANAERFSRPLHIALTFDEEAGLIGASQFAPFLDRLGVRPALMVIGEPTQMRPIMGHKAQIELTTVVRGSAGHGSNPQGRVNAISYASRLIGHINEVAARLIGEADPTSPFVPAETTLNIGCISGGQARNVIPDHVTFDWEIRPTPPDDGYAVRDGIMAWAADQLVPEMQAIDPQAGIEFIELADCPGMEARPGSPALELISRLWTNAEPSVVPFGTDAGHFQDYGIEVVVFGPGRLDQMHQPEEAMLRSELSDCLTFLDRLGAEWSSGQTR
jgi:acetylornithine deacetylase